MVLWGGQVNQRDARRTYEHQARHPSPGGVGKCHSVPSDGWSVILHLGLISNVSFRLLTFQQGPREPAVGRQRADMSTSWPRKPIRARRGARRQGACVRMCVRAKSWTLYIKKKLFYFTVIAFLDPTCSETPGWVNRFLRAAAHDTFCTPAGRLLAKFRSLPV